MTINRMEDLKGHMCRWPSGDPRHKEEFHFCGETRNSGSAYCTKHEHLARRGGNETKTQKAA